MQTFCDSLLSNYLKEQIILGAQMAGYHIDAAVIESAQRFLETRRGGTDRACRHIEAMLFEK